MLGNVLTAIVTPFHENGAVDFDAFQRLARHLVANGSDGIVVAGTTGESPTLDRSERLDLFRAALEAVGEEASVVAGTGTYSTAHSVHLTEQAHELGADGFLSSPRTTTSRRSAASSRTSKRSRRSATSRSSSTTFPRASSCTSSPRRSRRLAEIETVRAVKQAHDDLEQARHIVATGLDLYAGDDRLIQPFLEFGGVGGICVHTHIVGPQVAEQVQAALAGDIDRAREIDNSLAPAYELLRVADEPDRDQGCAASARARGRGHRLRWSTRPATRWLRFGAASSGSASSSRL